MRAVLMVRGSMAPSACSGDFRVESVQKLLIDGSLGDRKEARGERRRKSLFELHDARGDLARHPLTTEVSVGEVPNDQEYAWRGSDRG